MKALGRDRIDKDLWVVISFVVREINLKLKYF